MEPFLAIAGFIASTIAAMISVLSYITLSKKGEPIIRTNQLSLLNDDKFILTLFIYPSDEWVDFSGISAKNALIALEKSPSSSQSAFSKPEPLTELSESIPLTFTRVPAIIDREPLRLSLYIRFLNKKSSTRISLHMENRRFWQSTRITHVIQKQTV